MIRRFSKKMSEQSYLSLVQERAIAVSRGLNNTWANVAWHWDGQVLTCQVFDEDTRAVRSLTNNGFTERIGA